MAEHSFIWWIVIGLGAGVLGKLVMPGRDPGGFVVTVLIGIAGALLAGFVAQAFAYRLGEGWLSFVAAVGGAVVLLALYRLMVRRAPPA